MSRRLFGDPWNPTAEDWGKTSVGQYTGGSGCITCNGGGGCSPPSSCQGGCCIQDLHDSARNETYRNFTMPSYAEPLFPAFALGLVIGVTMYGASLVIDKVIK